VSDVTSLDYDPLVFRLRADALLERMAKELRGLLKDAARGLDPFPTFLYTTTEAIEADPGRLQRNDLGCIVVCPDGELYEISYSIFINQEMPSDTQLKDDLKKIDLPPRDFIPYAYNAICAINELAEQRRADQEG